MKLLLPLSLMCVVALSLVACGGRSGRLLTENEGDLVDNRKAGIEVYKRLINEAMPKLLASPQLERDMRMAFIDIENKTSEEMGANREGVYEIIDTQIVNSGRFKSVSKRLVDAAMAESGVRDASSILLAAGRERFVSVLRSNKAEPKYLLWGKITTLGSDASGERQRDYMLTMELLDAETGETIAKQTAATRKGYTE